MRATVELFYEDGDDDNYVYNDYEAEIDFYAYFIPACVLALPEDCYPAEGDSGWELIGVKQDGIEVDYATLPPEVKEKISEKIQEWVDENGIDYIQDYNEECQAEARYVHFEDDLKY